MTHQDGQEPTREPLTEGRDIIPLEEAYAYSQPVDIDKSLKKIAIDITRDVGGALGAIQNSADLMELYDSLGKLSLSVERFLELWGDSISLAFDKEDIKQVKALGAVSSETIVKIAARNIVKSSKGDQSEEFILEDRKARAYRDDELIPLLEEFLQIEFLKIDTMRVEAVSKTELEALEAMREESQKNSNEATG